MYLLATLRITGCVFTEEIIVAYILSLKGIFTSTTILVKKAHHSAAILLQHDHLLDPKLSDS